MNLEFINSQIKKQTEYMMSKHSQNNQSLSEMSAAFSRIEPQPNNNLENRELTRMQQITNSENILEQLSNSESSSTANVKALNATETNIIEPSKMTTQIYTAEISNKRKLSNIIYNSLVKRIQNVNEEYISEKHIQFIIKKLNLDENPNNWSKQEVDKFTLVVNKLIEKNKELESNKINLPITKLDNLDDKQLLIEPENLEKEFNSDLFERNTKEKVYYIAIDSRDRRRKVWPTSSEYRILFAPPSDMISDDPTIGHINRKFANVVSVQLVSAIIPRFSIDGDCIDSYPYILLDIEELGGIYNGTNSTTSRAFCKITFDTVVGKYVHFSPKNYEPLIKYFNPRIDLSRLTIRFLKPNGELFDFGTSINYCHPECVAAYLKRKKKKGEKSKKVKCKLSSKKNCEEDEPNNSLTFKITTINKSLDTMFLHPN